MLRNYTLLVAAILILSGIASASLVVSVPTIQIGATQTLTGQASGGVPPYTFNFLVYNPSNVLTYSNTVVGNPSQQPDAILQYSNGLIVGYNASSNTNQSRGIALIEAVSNAVSGSSIYLKAETYDIGTSTIDESIGGTGGFNLYGAGKYQTVIKSTYSGSFGPVVSSGFNSITSDLEIYANSFTGNAVFPPYGLANGATDVPNAVLRNVYLYGYSDGIYYGTPATSTATLWAYNITTLTEWDSVVANTGSSVNIFDSYAHSVWNASHSATTMTAIRAGGGTLNVVNTIGNVVGDPTTGNARAFATATPGYIYGGSFTSSGNAADDLFVVVSAIYINATVTYHTSSGTISNTLGTYGGYGYLKSPLPPPGSPYGVKSATFTYTQSAPTGTWNALLVVKDSTGNVLTSDPTYNVIPGGNIFQVQQGQTAVGNNAGASGGNTPYTYHWFYSPPPCNTYSPIASLHPPDFNSTKTTYYWNTNSLTTLGISCFILQVTDNSGFVSNAPPVGVNVTSGVSQTIIINQDPLEALPFGIGIGAVLGVIIGRRQSKGVKDGRKQRNPNQ